MPRGVWHVLQCARPCTRYAPRFHSALCAGFGAYAPSFRNSQFQIFSGQRMPSSAGISFFGGTCLTGSTPCMKYAYSAFTSSSPTFAYDTYGIAGYRLSPFLDTPWRTARSKSS